MEWIDTAELAKMLTAYAPKVAGALLTLLIGFWMVGRVARLIRKTMEKSKIDDSVAPFLSSLISVGLKILVLLTVARMFGIETTSFVAIFTALAFAIGTALQGGLGHFASGVLVLIFKPYKVGDLVVVGGQQGRVKEIQVFNTVLATLDNKRIIVPNGLVTSNIITNISGQGTIGVELTFSISYTSNIDKAREIILEVGKTCPYILNDPAQRVVVASLANNSVDLATRPFCQSEHYWETYFYMNENVKKAFDREGISIPFPQVDVHVRPEA